MNGSRFLLYPVLAVALLVSAYAGLSGPAEAISAQESLVINVGDRVFFDFNSAALRPDAITTIARQARWLKSAPDVTVMIEGHTDYSGLEGKTIDLGCQRASAMKNALIERGIAAERLGTVSYGDRRPAVLGKMEAAWAQNRRAVMVVRTDWPLTSNCVVR